MCDQLDLFICQIHGISAGDDPAGKIRNRCLIDDAGLRTGLGEKLFQRDLVYIGNADEHVNVRNPFHCIIVRICLTGNIQLFADL